MLKNINGLLGHKLQAEDGELGSVDEFYFDDRTWDIRYLVADTGGWLGGRKVLIAPVALKAPDWDAKTFPVKLTREQVKNSPDIDTRKTVSRRHELELYKHYAWPLYWGESFYAGSASGAPMLPDPGLEEERKPEPIPPEDAGLQGTRAVTGYKLHAADGVIGHVEDFIIDEEAWTIRYLVADTGLWLPGRKVIISPHWIERVDWGTSEVYVDLTREAVRQSPGFDPAVPVSEDYESALYDHYGRPKFETPPPAAGREKR